MYTEDSSLIGGRSAALARWRAAIAEHNASDAEVLTDLYQAFGATAGLCVDLALAQAVQETGWFTSAAYRLRRNMAGIGITGDAVLGPQFGMIARGVQAHIALLCCYAMASTPDAVRAWGVLESFGLGGFQRDRPRLGDLDGHWAVPGDGYGAAIAAIANGVVGMEQQRTVRGEDVVRAALAHEGETHESDTWNGDHVVSMMCQADVEDWQFEATGVEPQHFVSARAARESAPVQFGEPDLGAQIWMSGPEWSPFDHTGVYIGDGRVVSGLSSVIVSTGWIDRADFAGWRRLVGVSSGVVVPAREALRTAPGNPIPGNPGMLHPFSSRWFLLDALGLALPMMGWPVAPEGVLPNGRRYQDFQRGRFAVQDAPNPWDCVLMMPGELPGVLAVGPAPGVLPPRQP
jgi:hypothetical protein